MTGVLFLLEASWFVLRHLGAVAIFGWIAAALGLRLLRAFPGFPAFPSISRVEGAALGARAESAALGGAVGLAALGYAAFLLGLLGWLTAGAALALLAGALLWSRAEAVALLGDLVAPLRRRGAAGAGERAGRRLLVFAPVLLPMLVLALYPPTGFDALNYHLPYARAFVEHHALVVVETVRLPVFPQLNELLFALLLLLVDDVAAEAVQLLPTLLVALLVAGWAGRAGGRRSGPRAAALWLGNPLVVWMSAQGYVDLGLTLFVVAGFYCLERWRTGGGGRFATLGGALLGAACGVKYLGIIAAVLGICHTRAGPPGSRRRAALAVGLAALLVAAPWYVRIAQVTGNPVFPFLRGVFGTNERWRPPAVTAVPPATGGPEGWTARAGERGRKWARDGLWVVTVPFTVTWAREMYNRQAPLSPWTVVLVAAALWQARHDRRLAWLVAGCGAYVVAIAWFPHRDLRYLLPPAAAVAAGGAVALAPLVSRLLRRLGPLDPGGRKIEALVLLAFLGPGAFYGCYKVWERGPPPITPAAREAFLARWVPGYQAVARLNRWHGDDYVVYGLPFEPVRYYARGRYLGDMHGLYSFRRVAPLLGEPARLHEALRGWDVGYLLLGRDAASTVEGRSPCFAAVYRDAEAVLFRLAGDGAAGCDGGAAVVGQGG